MKRPILVRFTKSGDPQVYSDTIGVEWCEHPSVVRVRACKALKAKLRKFTRTQATLVSWTVAEDHAHSTPARGSDSWVEPYDD